MAPVLRKAKLASANSTIATQTLTSLIATLDYFCHMKEMEANHKEKVGALVPTRLSFLVF